MATALNARRWAAAAKASGTPHQSAGVPSRFMSIPSCCYLRMLCTFYFIKLPPRPASGATSFGHWPKLLPPPWPRPAQDHSSDQSSPLQMLLAVLQFVF